MKAYIKHIMMLMLAAIALPAMAQKDNFFNPVTTSVTSQSIAPDARSAGMGDVGVATDPDVVSQYWNPAKYPFTISRAGVALNYTPWLRQLVSDIDLAYLVGYYRIGDYSAISGSLRYFSLGEVFTSSSEDGTNDMTINPYEMSLDVAYSLMLSEHFSLSAGVRWIYSDLTYDYTEDTSPGSAFAADLSMYYQNYLNIGSRECQLGLGLNVSNIGSKITFGGSDDSEFIPTNLRLGASLMVPIDEYNRFTIAADANKLLVCRKITTTYLLSAVYSRVSVMLLTASRRNCKRYNGAWVPNMYTTTSSLFVLVIITRARTRVTANTSPWVPVSA